MIELSKLDEIAEQIRRLLPQGSNELREEVRANIKAVLEAALGRMNLVTREDFDAQAALLARTREKLALLEGAVAMLEKAD